MLKYNFTFLKGKSSEFWVFLCQSEAFSLLLQAQTNDSIDFQWSKSKLISSSTSENDKNFWRRTFRKRFGPKSARFFSSFIQLNRFSGVSHLPCEMRTLGDDGILKCQFSTPVQKRCRRPLYMSASKESASHHLAPRCDSFRWFHALVSWGMFLFLLRSIVFIRFHRVLKFRCNFEFQAAKSWCWWKYNRLELYSNAANTYEGYFLLLLPNQTTNLQRDPKCQIAHFRRMRYEMHDCARIQEGAKPCR